MFQVFKLLRSTKVRWHMWVKKFKINYCGRHHCAFGLVTLIIILINVLLFYDVKPWSFYVLKTEENSVKRSQPDTVILLTMIRSGSSILGSIFNERTNVTYLYEPLYPFGLISGVKECNEKFTKDEISSVLRFIAKCDFEKILPFYRQSKRTNEFAKCLENHLCFVEGSLKAPKFLSRDAKICHVDRRIGQVCPKPIDPIALKSHCEKSLLIVLKLTYLCHFEWILPLLKEKETNIKVVHLVRDPRSTVNSRKSPDASLAKIEEAAHRVCGRLQENLPIGDMMMRTSLLQEKYLRVRFEDFVTNPLRQTEEIYKFVGIAMTNQVKSWLSDAISSKNPKGLSRIQRFTITRNPNDVLVAWRRELSFEKMRIVQKICLNILKQMNYRIYDKRNNYYNISELHFFPR